jgi:histidyl-tRNA synthetase
MERRQYRAPRGVRDVLPEEIPAWRALEETAHRLARLRGFREIRPALLEELALFTRSVGEVTDIVQKEMFTLQKGETELALRPEGTAGIVRAYLEAGYAKTEPVQRLYHVGPMFRYERPQKGRERMFTQFDVEALGSLDPRLDAEVILLAADFFEEFGLTDIEVRVNSMGDGDDRDRWREAVRAFLAPTIAERCEQCRERFERNVLRVLDCKNPRCKELNAGAPSILGSCRTRTRGTSSASRSSSRRMHRKVVIDSGIVRGSTTTPGRCSRSTRPASVPAARSVAGAATTISSVTSVARIWAPSASRSVSRRRWSCCAISACSWSRRASDRYTWLSRERETSSGAVLEREAFAVAAMLRAAGVSCIYDVEGRSLKAQMKQAGKGGHRFAVVLGPEEAQAPDGAAQGSVDGRPARDHARCSRRRDPDCRGASAKAGAGVIVPLSDEAARRARAWASSAEPSIRRTKATCTRRGARARRSRSTTSCSCPPRRRRTRASASSRRRPSAWRCSRSCSRRAALLDLGAELERDGPSYTVDTLHALRAEVGPATRFFLILGEDNLASFASWYRAEEIVRLAQPVVVHRVAPGVTEALASVLSEFTRARFALGQLSGGTVDVSSTALREQLGRGELPEQGLPAACARTSACTAVSTAHRILK